MTFRPFLLRKEVIQPHLPIRLPCYDFTPVTGSTFDSSLQKVGSLASGISDSHGVTGGVYKTRERIHGAVADAPLLAIQHAAVNTFPGLVHTARHTMGAGNTRSQ